jgi:hypothetical protein
MRSDDQLRVQRILRERARQPGWNEPAEPAGHEAADRPLDKMERMRARHLLQELSENAKSVRNAMDPGTGMHTIRVSQWLAQYDSLVAELKFFTDKLRGEARLLWPWKSGPGTRCGLTPRISGGPPR